MTVETLPTIDEVRAKRAALPPADQIPNTIVAQSDYMTRQGTLDRIIAEAGRLEPIVAETTAQIAANTKMITDLREIKEKLGLEREALGAHLNDRATMNRISGLEISDLVIDGRFNLNQEAFPEHLPLFAELTARGYVAPDHCQWNPMASLRPLPFLEEEIERLEKRRTEARCMLDGALRHAATL
jgi:hypothetical protein